MESPVNINVRVLRAKDNLQENHMRQIVFMTLASDDRVSCWDIESSTGKLSLLSQTTVDGRPAPLAVDTQSRFLYIGRRDIPRVSSYRFDPENGNIEHHADGPVLQGDPCYLSLDKTSKYLLSAYYSAGAVSVHELKNGAFEGWSDWIPTGNGAHSVMTDSSNTFAMLPHIAGEHGINTIRLFKFNDSTGELSPNDPSEMGQPDNRGHRHYTFHPSGRFVYFSNEQECSVTAYSFDSSSGAIKEVQTESTLPMHYGGVNSCAQIRVTPDGRYLYAPNRGHNSLAGFSVDSCYGNLRQIGRTSTEAIPRVLDIDTTGKYLYSAGLETGHVSAFRIMDNGSLELIDRYQVGNEPMWIQVVPAE